MTTSVSSLSEEVSLKFASALKGLAVHQENSKVVDRGHRDTPGEQGGLQGDHRGPQDEAGQRRAPAVARLGDGRRHQQLGHSQQICGSEVDLVAPPRPQLHGRAHHDLGPHRGGGKRAASARPSWTPCPRSPAQKLHILASGDLPRLSSRAAQEKVRIAQNIVAAIVDPRTRYLLGGAGRLRPCGRQLLGVVPLGPQGLGNYLWRRGGEVALPGRLDAEGCQELGLRRLGAAQDLRPLVVGGRMSEGRCNYDKAPQPSPLALLLLPRPKDSEQPALKKALNMFE